MKLLLLTLNCLIRWKDILRVSICIHKLVVRARQLDSVAQLVRALHRCPGVLGRP
jgi:hypothetical protein